MEKKESGNNAMDNGHNPYPRRRKNNVTIRDVALRAGVSTSTAGRAVGNCGYVSDETKRKVLKAMKEIGYHPNGIARSLRTRRTQTIAYLVPSLPILFFLR